MNILRSALYKDDLLGLVSLGDDLSFAVAYVTQDGLDVIRDGMEALLNQGKSVRILLDFKSGNTDPSAVWALRSLAERFANLQVKTYIAKEDHGIIHSKLYIAHSSKAITFLTGSANLTGAALFRNREHGLHVHGAADDPDIAQSLADFQELWNASESVPIDDEAARLYETYCGRLRSVQTRTGRRSQAAWNALTDHLAEVGPEPFDWPSVRTAYLMGIIAARGELLTDKQSLQIKLLFRANAYTGGAISVRGVSYDSSTTLPSIPQAIAANVRSVIHNADVTIQKMTLTINLSKAPDAFSAIKTAYRPNLDSDTFRLPRGLITAEENIVTEFVRGFAVASALLTDHTSLPGNKRTGLPGQMVVWLRPKKSNQRMFDSLYNLMRDRLGIAVYSHARIDRDPHLKIRCEDFEERIGFGIDWWDALVRAGAQHNFSLFPQMPLDV